MPRTRKVMQVIDLNTGKPVAVCDRFTSPSLRGCLTPRAADLFKERLDIFNTTFKGQRYGLKETTIEVEEPRHEPTGLGQKSALFNG